MQAFADETPEIQTGSVKPDLREQVGIAVNSSSLVMRARGEGDLDRVAGLGAAALAVQLGADRRGSIAAAAGARVPDRPDAQRDRLAAELGLVLWHVRYGRQHEHLSRAVALFADYIMGRPQFAEIEPPEARRLMLVPFAELAIHEWLSDRCISCGGSGKLERTRGGALVRPRGSMQRNARFAPCRGCGGNGKARANHKTRVRALGIPKKWYFDQRWPGRFLMAFQWLDHIARRLSHPLRVQLERRYGPDDRRAFDGGES